MSYKYNGVTIFNTGGDFSMFEFELAVALAVLGNREKAILADLKQVRIEQLASPGDKKTIAHFYDTEGRGFSLIVKHYDSRGKAYEYKPGHISG